MSARVSITPREAAALDRLLDAYQDYTDPGMADLATLCVKVRRLDQDHAAYDPDPDEAGELPDDLPAQPATPGGAW